MKKITKILLLLGLFGSLFQISFSSSLNFDKIKSFDWFLGVENLENIKTTSQVVDIDVLDSSKEIVQKFHKQGKIVIGYINAGSIENYRDDYKKFPKSVIGKTYPDWEDERFLDIKNYSKFKHLIINYLDTAKQKGFDGIEFDNIDTFDNEEETGFKITKEDELDYLSFLEKETHKRSMFILQKNAPSLSADLVNKFDGALLEDAFFEKIENNFTNYIKNKKIVFNVEYTDNVSKKQFLENICPKSQKLGFISILKNRDLDDFVMKCKLNKNQIIIEKYSKIILNYVNKKNINLEVFIYKIEKILKKKKISKKVKLILSGILDNLKNNVCNNYYKVHKNINASVFWVGEKANKSNANISNITSAWDDNWLENSKNENKYYFALPYNDFDEKGARKNNSKKIPWYKLKKWGEKESIVKNRWIKINANGKIAYAQWEDVGPLLEDDFDYVFGNLKPKNNFGLKAGIDLSPDLAKYLNIDGNGNVNWNFIPEYCVDNGIFNKKITNSKINWK